MPIKVACPMCGRTGRVPEHAIGRNIQCPACGHRRKLTAESAVPEMIELGETTTGIDGLEILDDERAPRSRPQAPSLSGANELEILDDEPAPRTRPKAPSRSRPRPAVRTTSMPDEAQPPDPETPWLSPAYVVAALSVGIIAVSIVFLVLHSRARQDRAAERPEVASAAAPRGNLDEGRGKAPVRPPVTEPASSVATAPAAATPAPATIALAPETGTRAPVPLSTADLVARCEPSVALIKGKEGSGTGFLVAPGILVTNSHVIDDEFISGLEVRFPSAEDSKKGPILAELLYEDEKRDLAFLAVRTDLPTLEVARSYQYRKGEDVTVIGNPGLDGDTVLENAISRGVMSTKAELDGQQFYQLGIAVNPGNSGGPVFDQFGRVIGVVTLRIPGKEELSFCIPVEELRAAMAKLEAQTPDEATSARVRHRMLASFKALSGAGALYGVGLELHAAARSNAGSNDLSEIIQKLDKVLDELKTSILGTLEAEARIAQNETTVPSAIRRQVGDLAESYQRLREAFEQNRASTPVATIRLLKSGHRRHVVGLGSALGVEVPKGLLDLLDDHLAASQVVVANLPITRGNKPLTPGDALRQQMWERHRRLIPQTTIPRPPSSSSRFGPRIPGRSIPRRPAF